MIAELEALRTELTSIPGFAENNEDIISEIDGLLDILELNEERGLEEYQYSRFWKASAADFVNKDSTDAATKKIIEKSKRRSNRNKDATSKKVIRCNSCQIPLEFIDGIQQCTQCGFQLETKNKNHSIAENNTQKHIRKQLDMLTGIHKPSKAIISLSPIVEEWFNDKTHIRDWLDITDSTDKFLTKLNKIRTKMGSQGFGTIDEFVETNEWVSYGEFKLICNQLFEILKTIHQFDYANLLLRCSSKINKLTERNEDLAVYLQNWKENLKKLIQGSQLEEQLHLTVITGENIHEIMLALSLSNNTEFYKKMEDTYGVNIKFPGLICNREELFQPIKMKMPRKYGFQQEYSYFMNKIYHIPFVDISATDKTQIADIIHKFNEFYKAELSKDNTTKNNSPLCCCTLRNIIDMPAFNKYQPVLKLLPSKDSDTLRSIKAVFLQFRMSDSS